VGDGEKGKVVGKNGAALLLIQQKGKRQGGGNQVGTFQPKKTREGKEGKGGQLKRKISLTRPTGAKPFQKLRGNTKGNDQIIDRKKREERGPIC